jgi:stage III sporulation protein AG
MEQAGFLEKIKQFLRKENNLQLSIAGVAALALLVYIVSTTIQPAVDVQAEQTAAVGTADQVSASLEGKLEQILSQIENAGQVKVMITYSSGAEIVPAMSVDTQKNTSDGGSDGSENHTDSITENREPVVVQGKNGTEPLVLMQKEPTVLGVLVVAEGASALDVRIRLLTAVQVALQLPADRIEVLPMGISN